MLRINFYVELVVVVSSEPEHFTGLQEYKQCTFSTKLS